MKIINKKSATVLTMVFLSSTLIGCGESITNADSRKMGERSHQMRNTDPSPVPEGQHDMKNTDPSPTPESKHTMQNN